MECKNCGTLLPDEANFCLSCGRRQADEAAGEQTAWETCTIDFSVETKSDRFTPPKIKFVALAENLYGKYIASRSPVINGERSYELEFPAVHDDTDREAAEETLKNLENELEKKRWKKIGTWGHRYWQLRFRREMK